MINLNMLEEENDLDILNKFKKIISNLINKKI